MRSKGWIRIVFFPLVLLSKMSRARWVFLLSGSDSQTVIYYSKEHITDRSDISVIFKYYNDLLPPLSSCPPFFFYFFPEKTERKNRLKTSPFFCVCSIVITMGKYFIKNTSESVINFFDKAFQKIKNCDFFLNP